MISGIHTPKMDQGLLYYIINVYQVGDVLTQSGIDTTEMDFNFCIIGK